MAIFGMLIMFAVRIFVFVVILQVLISWLIAFDIVNARNEAAQNLMALLTKITDPVYKPIRKYVPPIGGIDITPLIVIIGVQILGSMLASIFY